MSITRRIIDTARSGINSVMERIAADDTPLTHVDPAELQRELEQRLAARKNGARPEDNPRARMAGASAEARRQRAALAEKRAARIKAAREKREREVQAAQDEFFRRARAQASASSGRATGSAGSSSSTGSSSSGRASSGSSRGARSPFGQKDQKIAEYYKVLDLPEGADFAQVKTAYRRLMRKYHPDRHVGNPKKLKAATELSMRVTQAYNALEEHLKGKK